jgi:hypothetical protein
VVAWRGERPQPCNRTADRHLFMELWQVEARGPQLMQEFGPLRGRQHDIFPGAQHVRQRSEVASKCDEIL